MYGKELTDLEWDGNVKQKGCEIELTSWNPQNSEKIMVDRKNKQEE